MAIFGFLQSLSPNVDFGFLDLALLPADPSSHQDESTSQRLSLNGSQHGNCSTEYNTPAGT
jgi:hypothetical protein